MNFLNTALPFISYAAMVSDRDDLDWEVMLRPVRLPEDLDIATAWYGDEEVLKYSGETSVSYPKSKVEEMYRYLSARGEAYIIEVKCEGRWLPVGDAAVTEDSTPIVIGVGEFRSKGTGGIVLDRLIELSRVKG